MLTKTQARDLSALPVHVRHNSQSPAVLRAQYPSSLLPCSQHHARRCIRSRRPQSRPVPPSVSAEVVADAAVHVAQELDVAHRAAHLHARAHALRAALSRVAHECEIVHLT
jgi:hypothetical protein